MLGIKQTLEMNGNFCCLGHAPNQHVHGISELAQHMSLQAILPFLVRDGVEMSFLSIDVSGMDVLKKIYSH